KMSYDDAKAALGKLNLPIGWTGWTPSFWPPPDLADFPKQFVFPWLGWLLTAIAASLGAPFWFDILNKVMVIRSTVKPHEKSPEEASDDRQKPAAATTTVVICPTGTTTSTAASSPPPVSPGGTASDDAVDACDAVAAAAADPTGD